MILAEYLSAESVRRRSEKPPRERERDEHIERPEKQLKSAKPRCLSAEIMVFEGLTRKTA